MNASTVILPQDRSTAEAAADAIERWYDKGGAVLDTDTILHWARSPYTRGLKAAWLREHLDPEGLHLVKIAFIHNDAEWRMNGMLKDKDRSADEDPIMVTFDVSMDSEFWERAREGTARNIAILRAAAKGEQPPA